MNPENPFLAPRPKSAARRGGLAGFQPSLAAEVVFAITVAVCGVSLVLSKYSEIWPGPDLRLGTSESLPMRLLAVAGLGLSALLFAVADGHPFRRPLGRLLPLPLVCLIALTILVLFGSIQSRMAGNTESFFTLGMGLLAAPLAYWCFELAKDRDRLVVAMLIGLGIGTVPILASSVARFLGTDGAFCEYFPVPFACAAMIWFRWPVLAVRIPVAVLMVGMCVLSLKKTGVIACGALALPVLVDAVIVRFGPTRRAGMIITGLALLLIAGTAGIFTVMSDSYRSGAMGFRQYSFEFAWHQFLRSPLWGECYQGSSTIINPYLTGNRVAVHNDLLDIMRQGGLIALIAFVIGTLWPLWIMARHLRHWALVPPALKAMATAMIGSYAIMLFNPVLLTPDVAVVVWVVAAAGIWHCHQFKQGITAQETATWRTR